MSTRESHTQELFEVSQEPDDVPARKVSVVLLVAVVITIASAGVAAVLLEARRASLSFHEAPASTPAPRQIDGIHQTLIARDRHGVELRETQRRALDEYRFIDRERGVVQIPIDRAMQIVVDDAAKARAGGTR